MTTHVSARRQPHPNPAPGPGSSKALQPARQRQHCRDIDRTFDDDPPAAPKHNLRPRHRSGCLRRRNRLAEAGCTNKEIAAITGYTTDAQVNLYTKAASQKLLSDKAMQALQESEQGTKSANPDGAVSKTGS